MMLEGVEWGVCRIQCDEGYEAWLTDSERQEYLNIRSQQRKREWLGARVALKRIVMNRKAISSPVNCLIKKDSLGRPWLKITRRHSLETIPCSISHKAGIAMVCVSSSSELDVGIDLERLNDRPYRLRTAFISRDDTLTGETDLVRTSAILWACKEAASKAMGLGLLVDFRELVTQGREFERFTVVRNNAFIAKGTYHVFGDSVLAMAFRYGLRPLNGPFGGSLSTTTLSHGL